MATKMLIAGVLAMLIPGSLVAQAVSGNQDPPGLDWRQIQTKRFTVIFPEAIIHRCPAGSQYARTHLWPGL